MDLYSLALGLVVLIFSVLHHLYIDHLKTLIFPPELIGIKGSKSRRPKRRIPNFLTPEGDIDCSTLQSELYEMIKVRDALRVREYYRIFLYSCYSDEIERQKMQNYFEIFFEEYGASMDEETIKNTQFNRHIEVDPVPKKATETTQRRNKRRKRRNKSSKNVKCDGEGSPKSVSVKILAEAPDIDDPRRSKRKYVSISNIVQYHVIE